MNKPNKTVILVVGPTAVGKTEVCIQLAKWLKTEVVSCDSRQFYKEMSIGTAKPTLSEQQGVRHWFIHSHSIETHYSAGDYERDALLVLDELFKVHDVVIVTGGSGLFVKALTEGLDEMPTAPTELRQKLMQRLENEGVEVLANELKTLDPLYASTADLANSQRVVRALEVCLSTGRTFSSFHKNQAATRPFSWIKIGLERPRDELYERINKRVEAMLAAGLLDEVRSLMPFQSHNALQTVGYKEVFGFLANEYDYPTMLALLQRNTRRYAKRQMTWFKNQENLTWFVPNQLADIQDFIKEKLLTRNN